MSSLVATSQSELRRDSLLPRIAMPLAAFAGGLAVTILIFLGVSATQRTPTVSQETDIVELHAFSNTLQPPPPPDKQEEAPALPRSDVIQFAEARSDSSVKIFATPLTLEIQTQPASIPRFDFSITAFQPSALKVGFDDTHVYEAAEVDQQPMAIWKSHPDLKAEQFSSIKNLRPKFLFVVNAAGGVEAVRMLSSSQNPDVDKLCMDALHEWKFSPAIRKGKKVRCWIQQGFVIKAPSASRFENN